MSVARTENRLTHAHRSCLTLSTVTPFHTCAGAGASEQLKQSRPPPARWRKA